MSVAMETNERKYVRKKPSPGTSLIDVLLLQLGTPRSPTAAGLRPYLRQFLSDGRVLEFPALARWLLVNGIIVPFRSPRSAVKYQRIWHSETGSPLMSITEAQTSRLAEALGDGYRVRFAMRYGAPSIGGVVRQMIADGCERMVVVPMFPQYSATTTASGLDDLFAALQRERVVPFLRVIRDYHQDAGYIEAVAQCIERRLAEAAHEGRTPDMKILSFHGIPIQYVKRGDPYMRQSAATAKKIAKRLGWAKGEWLLTFQSRLGGQKWLLPYFDKTIERLGREGKKVVLVAQPGFTADCLETIDEIGNEGREDFERAGGEHLLRVPCLNDDPLFIAALKSMVQREAQGWR